MVPIKTFPLFWACQNPTSPRTSDHWNQPVEALWGSHNVGGLSAVSWHQVSPLWFLGPHVCPLWALFCFGQGDTILASWTLTPCSPITVRAPTTLSTACLLKTEDLQWKQDSNLRKNTNFPVCLCQWSQLLVTLMKQGKQGENQETIHFILRLLPRNRLGIIIY